MKLSEQLKVISPPDRIRIIQGKLGNKEPDRDPNVKILYCGYAGSLEYTEEREFLARDPEVVQLVASLEIRHRQHKERGLMPPYEPEITRLYEFRDLTIFLYYDIYIQ